MKKILVAFMRATTNVEGIAVADRAYNCVIDPDTVQAVGSYTIAVGKGGVDSANMIVEVEKELAAAAADVAIESVRDISDTKKTIQFRDIAGALVAPVGFAVSIYKLTPALGPLAAP